MFKFPFHYRAHDARNKHRFYENYINDIAHKLLEEREHLNKAYNDAIAEAQNEDHENSIQSAFEDLWMENYERTPSLLYGSIFLSLYGYLEGTLKNCYEDCVREWGFGYPSLEQKKKTIDHYKGFFNKHKLYIFPNDRENFKFIDDCEIIRDKLIHTTGELNEKEMNDIGGVLSKYDSISVRDDRFYITDKKLLLQLNDVIREIIEPMCKHLYDTIRAY